MKLRRFKEALERLREQAKRKFFEEQEKLEQKQLDEAATLSFNRESRESDKKADEELSAGIKENEK